MNLGAFVKKYLPRINKAVINPIVLSIAGRPGMPHGMVRHIGRSSGRVYTTPVLVHKANHHFIIPLTYGVDTDWSRNVRETGHAVVVTGGHAYRVIKPEVVDYHVVRGVLPRWMDAFQRAVQTDKVLRLSRASSSPEPQATYRRITANYPVIRALAAIAVVLSLGIAFLIWRLRRTH